MKNIITTLLLALGLACIAGPARADSDSYFVQITSQASAAVIVSTINSGGHPIKYYALQVSGVSVTATAWDVLLEGSLDGTKFSTIIEHKTSDGNGAVNAMPSSVGYGGGYTYEMFPVFWIRARVVSLTLGSATKIQITALGMQ